MSLARISQSGKPALLCLPIPTTVVDGADPASGLKFALGRGHPAYDALDGKQISAANVVILFGEHRPTDIVEDSIGATSINIIRRAAVAAGAARWCGNRGHLEAGIARAIVFYDASGNEIALKPGKPAQLVRRLRGRDQRRSRLA